MVKHEYVRAWAKSMWTRCSWYLTSNNTDVYLLIVLYTMKNYYEGSSLIIFEFLLLASRSFLIHSKICSLNKRVETSTLYCPNRTTAARDRVKSPLETSVFKNQAEQSSFQWLVWQINIAVLIYTIERTSKSDLLYFHAWWSFRHLSNNSCMCNHVKANITTVPR